MELVDKVVSVAKFIPKRINEISKDEVKEIVSNYYGGKWSNFVKDYVACGVGETVLSAPIWATLETWGAKAVSEVFPFLHQYGVEFSKTQRWGWAALNLLLLGYVSHKGRSAFRWFFKYDDSQKELVDSLGHKKKVMGHDGKLGMVVGTITSGIGYFLGKHYSVVQSATQTGISPVGNYTVGAANGLANDITQECLDASHPKRVPSWIKKLPKQEKHSLFGLLALSSFLSLNLIYGTYDLAFPTKDPTKKEIKLNNLEKFSLENSFPEFKLASSNESSYEIFKQRKKSFEELFSKSKNLYEENYNPAIVDGVKTDTQKYLTSKGVN